MVVLLTGKLDDIHLQLVDSAESVEGSLALKNGCICCTINEDLEVVLDKIVVSRGHELDYILLETSGISDPEPIVYTVNHGRVAERCFVDAVVTVVNADMAEHDVSSTEVCANRGCGVCMTATIVDDEVLAADGSKPDSLC